MEWAKKNFKEGLKKPSKYDLQHQERTKRSVEIKSNNIHQQSALLKLYH